MISTKHRFLFVHIPRTGGNSMTRALEPYVDDRVDWDGEHCGTHSDAFGMHTKHLTISDYIRRWDDDLLGDMGWYFKFCVVRNPWDRLRSLFTLDPGYASGDIGDRFKQVLRPENDVCRCTAAYVLDGERERMDAYIRFEHMQEDFDKVCANIGIPAMVFPKIHAAVYPDSFLALYEDSTNVEMVAEKEAWAIDKFGYSPPAW